MLVPAETDERIWDYFATAGIPTEEQVEQILDALARRPAVAGGIETATGIRRGRLEALLKILAVDEVVHAKARDGWTRPARPWYFDEPKLAALRAGAGRRGRPDARGTPAARAA